MSGIERSCQSMSVLIVKDSDYTESDANLIINALLGRIGRGITINVKSLDKIPLTESGKRRSFVSKLKVDFT